MNFRTSIKTFAFAAGALVAASAMSTDAQAEITISPFVGAASAPVADNSAATAGETQAQRVPQGYSAIVGMLPGQEEADRQGTQARVAPAGVEAERSFTGPFYSAKIGRHFH